MRYLVIIHKDPDSDFGVTIPDLPGCFSAGSTFEEAMDNAREAIECHVEGLLTDGEQPPLPGDTDEHMSNPDFAGGIAAFVEIDPRKLSGKAHRINVTIPENLLSLIDEFVEAQGESRSSFLSKAAIMLMRQPSAGRAKRKTTRRRRIA